MLSINELIWTGDSCEAGIFIFEGTIVRFGNKCKYDFLTCFLDVVLVKYLEIFRMRACLDSNDDSPGKWIR